MLQAASLAPDLEKLVRATTTLVYDYMKEKKIKRWFIWCKDSGGAPVKEKSVAMQIKKVITERWQ